MKSITGILGGAQILLGLAYELQDSFEEYLNADHRVSLAMLRVVEEHFPPLENTGSGMGRPAYENTPFFRIAPIEALRNRLLTDPNLRWICGFPAVLILAAFSRRFAEFSARPLSNSCLE